MTGPVDGPHLYGLARIAGHFVAVPIAGIREVVPHPPALAAMPATLPEMRGGLELRGAVVPVIDLGPLLGTEARSQAAAQEQTGDHGGVIMVLRTERGVFGVCVDQICGVVDLSRGRQTALELVAGGQGVAQGLVARGFSVSGQTGVVLDVDRMAAMPGLIVAEDRLVADEARTTGGPPILTFAVGRFRFGLCAEAIEPTLPRGTVWPSPVDDPVWIGRIDANGSRLPLVDTLALLGLGQCPQQRESASVVVRLAGGGRVALCIDTVIDMLRPGPDDCLGLQGFTLGEGAVIAGLRAGSPPILMLDPAALAQHPQLGNLAGLAEDREGERGTEGAGGSRAIGTTKAGRGHGARQPFLIFMLGDDQHATPLDQVTEILPYDPATLIDLAGATGPFQAMIAHRGVSVPVIDLGIAAGADTTGPDTTGPRAGYILIATSAQRSGGFLLDGLCAVERHARQAIATSDRAAQDLHGPRSGSGDRARPSGIGSRGGGLTDLALLVAGGGRAPIRELYGRCGPCRSGDATPHRRRTRDLG